MWAVALAGSPLCAKAVPSDNVNQTDVVNAGVEILAPLLID